MSYLNNFQKNKKNKKNKKIKKFQKKKISRKYLHSKKI